MSSGKAIQPCSSACPGRARPRCRLLRAVRCWGTTSTGGPGNVSSLSNAAATPSPSNCRPTPDRVCMGRPKVAGTEKGVKDPEATFSTCFGAPFTPRHPSEYGNLLRELIGAHGVDCWLVNTGWTGGKYGVGRRMPIKVTRTLLAAALDGSL